MVCQLTAGLVLALARVRGPRGIGSKGKGPRGCRCRIQPGPAIPRPVPACSDAAVCSTAGGGEPPVHLSLSSPRAGTARRPRWGAAWGRGRTPWDSAEGRRGQGPRAPSVPHSPAGRAQRGPPGARLPLARGAGAPSRAGRPRPGPGRAPPAPSSCRCLPCLRRRLPGPGPAGRAERRRVPRAACCCVSAATRGADKPAAAPPPAEPALHVRHGPARRGTAGDPARLRAQTH